MDDPMRFSRLFLIIVFFLGLADFAWAGENMVPSLSIPTTARAAAMGGAFVASSKDAASVYWNPAGLGIIRNFSASSSVLSNRIGDANGFMNNQYFLTAAIKIRPIGVWGLGWNHLPIKDIEHRDDENQLLDYFDDIEDIFFIGWGFPVVANRMYVGANIKFLRQKFTLANASASGHGISIGLAYQLTNYLRLGLRADDNFTMKWDNGHRDQVLFRGISGAALSLFNNKMTVALDLEQIRHQPLKANCGAEFIYEPEFLITSNSIGIRNLAIRCGLEDFYLEKRGLDLPYRKHSNVTFGFGVCLLVQNIQMEMDYSYQSHQIGSQKQFTLSMNFKH